MDEITLDGKGPLAAAMHGRGTRFSPRQIQTDYHTAVRKCFKDGRPGFIDAETGVGKTLAYLVAALEMAATLRSQSTRKPIVVVSTATVALQRQLMTADIPVILDAFAKAGSPQLKAAYRVGKSQIVDCSALESTVETYAEPQEKALADDIIAWVSSRIAEDTLPLVSDLFEAFADRIQTVPPWLSRTVIGLEPDRTTSNAETVALYMSLLNAANTADILIVNHHLLGLHLLRPFLWNNDRPAVVVVDEADRFPNIVEQLGACLVPLHNLGNLLTSGHDLIGDGTETSGEQAIEALLETLAKAWEGSAGGVTTMAHLDDTQKHGIKTALNTLAQETEKTLGKMQSHARASSPDVRERIADLERYAEYMRMIGDVAESSEAGRAIIYHTPVRKYPGLAIVRSGLARIIGEKLWNKPDGDVRALLFTSATLSTLAHVNDANAKRALTPFLRQCGFDTRKISDQSCAVIAPTRYGHMQFVRPALDAPSAFVKKTEDDDEPVEVTQEAIAYWCKMIVAAADEGGRVLVLVPSYRDIRLLGTLEEQFDERLILQTPGYLTGAAKERFLLRPDSIWISAAAWEGLSLPGAIQHIVVPRVPIRPTITEDKLLEQYYEEIGEKAWRGRSVIQAKRLAEARRRLRQGIGRGIRSHDDDVKIWIADRRWPLNQAEIDEHILEQPARWSPTLLNAVPKRFRKSVETAPRFDV